MSTGLYTALLVLSNCLGILRMKSYTLVMTSNQKVPSSNATWILGFTEWLGIDIHNDVFASLDLAKVLMCIATLAMGSHAVVLPVYTTTTWVWLQIKGSATSWIGTLCVVVVTVQISNVCIVCMYVHWLHTKRCSRPGCLHYPGPASLPLALS